MREETRLSILDLNQIVHFWLAIKRKMYDKGKQFMSLYDIWEWEAFKDDAASLTLYEISHLLKLSAKIVAIHGALGIVQVHI